MKIVYKEWMGKKDKPLTVKEAIDYSLTPSAYSYEGGHQVEYLQAQIDNLKELLSKLVVHLGEDDKEIVKAIIDYGLEVEE